MSEWVEVVGGSLPPSDHSVLLCIVRLHDDGESLCDDKIITGFYSEENKKWGYDRVEDGELDWKYFEESSQLKVVAWTLLPTYFDYDKYKLYRKSLSLDLFRS